MGNSLICKSKKDVKEIGSRSKRMGRSQRKLQSEEEFLQKQALSLALQQLQLSQRFDGSTSKRIGSTSSRRHNLSDPFCNGKQNQSKRDSRAEVTSGEANLQALDFLENVKEKKFVLVHGEGFGAWCWYKTISLLEEVGLSPIAIDLKGSGIDLTDTNKVDTLVEYSKPLIEYLQGLPDNEKVVLVGHSSGGACVSYALEHFSNKVSKAVYICATMVGDGQRPFDVFMEELGSEEIFMKGSKFLIYGNGKDEQPTGFMFEKEQMKGLYFNQSPTKDVALAMVSMRPFPLGPVMEKLSLSPENYGTGRRFFVQTLDDHALSPDIQEKLVRENPPERVFKIKGSDHCPFFSKPQSLHKILLEIAQIP
ncbi:putative methylesterase 12, chloroplastic isoform X1 [Cucurbita moschata]|uniref:Methylesterase 12, chloroplastic isoform X1 n=1 Tax=Cucurbita moschata TaxID=3662 RepID=A0A6J1ECB0_CUCMO|nr:putative methylesterase 12, chloroplastic isoform X1 [Cucurbita moschata]